MGNTTECQHGDLSTPKVWVLIPAYQPDDRLTILCEALKAGGQEDILLVDDGGGSAYSSIFEDLKTRLGCRVLRHDVNKGKGRGLKDGFNYLLKEEPEVLGCVTADADGQHAPSDILAMVQELRRAPQALTLGCRDFHDKKVPLPRRFGNLLTCRICKATTGIDVVDTQTGLRAIPRSLMEVLLDVPGERFEFETHMLIRTKRAGYEIRQYAIQTIYDSPQGYSTHFNVIFDTLIIHGILWKEMFRKG